MLRLEVILGGIVVLLASGCALADSPGGESLAFANQAAYPGGMFGVRGSATGLLAGETVPGLGWHSPISTGWHEVPGRCEPAAATASPCAASGTCGAVGPALEQNSSLGGLALRCAVAGPDLLPHPQDSLPAAIRLALHAETWRVWNRLDTSCQGITANRCSVFSLAVGIHGRSANLQWRVDGARALVPGHEFGHDAIHVRFQASYAFE